MGLTYPEILSLHFGENEFTSKEVSDLLHYERSAKLLSDLKFKGVLERTGRGRYRCLSPAERPDIRSIEWNRVTNIINRSPLEMAWDWSSAVERWTNGRYHVGPNPFHRIFYISVFRKDVEKWKDYLKSHEVATSGKKKVGASVELIPRKDVKFVHLNDEKVIPREDTLKIIKKHRGIFGEADKLIER